MTDLTRATGPDIRQACRAGRLTGPTPGLALGYVQANLVVVPRELAFDFLLFCHAQSEAVSAARRDRAGRPRAARSSPRTPTCAPTCRATASAATANWSTSRPTSATLWRDDLVAFLIGCSFTFENALLRAGVPVRHIEQGRNVPMYRTNRALSPGGRFRGPLVVSMRPLTPAQAVDGDAHLRALPARARRADPLRRPGRHRHPRPRPAGLRRRGGDSARRGAGLLGVRRDAAGGGDGGEAAAAADAQARAHVPDRPDRRRPRRVAA